MTRTVLILGASGKFGGHCSTAFRADGWTVRHFNRATDTMRIAAEGADVIVNGLNPPNYHNWKQLIPEITRTVIEAAKSSGATVILPGNVYPIGSAPGTWDENTPHAPCSRKGQIRQEMEHAYQQAAHEGIQVLNLRAGDIIDPLSNDTAMGRVILANLKKGRITRLGDPEARHAWCYAPDFARAAVALANRREGLAAYEDIPLPGPSFSPAELCAALAEQTGRNIRMSAFPWFALRLAGPFWELARELVDMRYLWDTPHALSGTKIARLLPDFQRTPDHEVLASLLQGHVHPDQPVVRAGLAI